MTDNTESSGGTDYQQTKGKPAADLSRAAGPESSGGDSGVLGSTQRPEPASGDTQAHRPDDTDPLTAGPDTAPRTDEAAHGKIHKSVAELEHTLADRERRIAELEQQVYQYPCEDCDHGIRCGEVCPSCDGSGKVLFSLLYAWTSAKKKELDKEVFMLKQNNTTLTAQLADTETVRDTWRRGCEKLDKELNIVRQHWVDAERHADAGVANAEDEAERRIASLIDKHAEVNTMADTERNAGMQCHAALDAERRAREEAEHRVDTMGKLLEQISKDRDAEKVVRIGAEHRAAQSSQRAEAAEARAANFQEQTTSYLRQAREANETCAAMFERTKERAAMIYSDVWMTPARKEYAEAILALQPEPEQGGKENPT